MHEKCMFAEEKLGNNKKKKKRHQEGNKLIITPLFRDEPPTINKHMHSLLFLLHEFHS